MNEQVSCPDEGDPVTHGDKAIEVLLPMPVRVSMWPVSQSEKRLSDGW